MINETKNSSIQEELAISVGNLKERMTCIERVTDELLAGNKSNLITKEQHDTELKNLQSSIMDLLDTNKNDIIHRTSADLSDEIKATKEEFNEVYAPKTTISKLEEKIEKLSQPSPTKIPVSNNVSTVSDDLRNQFDFLKNNLIPGLESNIRSMDSTVDKVFSVSEEHTKTLNSLETMNFDLKNKYDALEQQLKDAITNFNDRLNSLSKQPPSTIIKSPQQSPKPSQSPSSRHLSFESNSVPPLENQKTSNTPPLIIEHLPKTINKDSIIDRAVEVVLQKVEPRIEQLEITNKKLIRQYHHQSVHISHLNQRIIYLKQQLADHNILPDIYIEAEDEYFYYSDDSSTENLSPIENARRKKNKNKNANENDIDNATEINATEINATEINATEINNSTQGSNNSSPHNSNNISHNPSNKPSDNASNNASNNPSNKVSNNVSNKNSGNVSNANSSDDISQPIDLSAPIDQAKLSVQNLLDHDYFENNKPVTHSKNQNDLFDVDTDYDGYYDASDYDDYDYDISDEQQQQNNRGGELNINHNYNINGDININQETKTITETIHKHRSIKGRKRKALTHSTNNGENGGENGENNGGNGGENGENNGRNGGNGENGGNNGENRGNSGNSENGGNREEKHHRKSRNKSHHHKNRHSVDKPNQEYIPTVSQPTSPLLSSHISPQGSHYDFESLEELKRRVTSLEEAFQYLQNSYINTENSHSIATSPLVRSPVMTPTSTSQIKSKINLLEDRVTNLEGEMTSVQEPNFEVVTRVDRGEDTPDYETIVHTQIILPNVQSNKKDVIEIQTDPNPEYDTFDIYSKETHDFPEVRSFSSHGSPYRSRSPSSSFSKCSCFNIC